MKKILIILSFMSLLFITACSVRSPKQVIDGDEVTSVKLQDTPKDTVLMTVDAEGVVYIFDVHNKLQYTLIDNVDDYVQVHFAYALFTAFLLIIGTIIFVVAAINKFIDG